MTSGVRFVLTRWSGQAAPLSASDARRVLFTNSRTSGESSNVSTIRRCRLTAPRMTGRFSCTNRARTPASAGLIFGPPNTFFPASFRFRKSCASPITVIVAL